MLCRDLALVLVLLIGGGAAGRVRFVGVKPLKLRSEAIRVLRLIDLIRVTGDCDCGGTCIRLGAWRGPAEGDAHGCCRYACCACPTVWFLRWSR